MKLSEGIYAWAVIASLKLLLSKCYRSTDFEVHRHWKATTYSLPFAQWYTDNTSHWTLDYPPFFAYFEWLLAQVAVLVDPGIVALGNDGYASDACVMFMRATVVLGDLFLILVSILYLKERANTKTLALIVASPALVIVDNIHFQYNAWLFGMFILSIFLIDRGWVHCGAAVFTALVCAKHIFAYVGPVMLVYLLKTYVSSSSRKFTSLAVTVASVVAVAVAPLISTGQLTAAVGRMFPFGRGLVHAYWAPNIWALYLFTDRLIAKLFGVVVPSGTHGLVQDVHFAVLPNITPLVSLVTTLLLYYPLLMVIWRQPRQWPLAVWAAMGSFVAFLAGWHVHEKAILMVLIPLALEAQRNINLSAIYANLSVIAGVSLLPLLPNRAETLLKWAILMTGLSLDNLLLVPSASMVYYPALAAGFYSDFLHSIGPLATWKFLPLMLVSVVCAVLNLQSFFNLLMLTSRPRPKST